MYSYLLRLAYSVTYYIHLGIIVEAYKIYNQGLYPVYESDASYISIATDLLSIHYPLFFVIYCLIFAKIMVVNSKKLAGYSIQMKSEEAYNIEILYTGVQIAPYLTFLLKTEWLNKWGTVVLVILPVFFLVAHGTYNLSLAFLGYKQYKVKTNNTTCWLICKRRISNFSNSEYIHILQDNVFVRHE